MNERVAELNDELNAIPRRLPSHAMASVDTVDMAEAFWRVISFIQRVFDNMYWVGISKPAYKMEEMESESSTEGGDDSEGLDTDARGFDSDA